jgi:hypothetical protein
MPEQAANRAHERDRFGQSTGRMFAQGSRRPA